jgi:septal ring factor EnvC (AmiA/AmiB activator)
VKDCLEERVSLEIKWLKMVLSIKEKAADMEKCCDQRIADLRAELDQSRHALDSLRETFEESVKGVDTRFSKLKEHFDKASERVAGLEVSLNHTRGDLETARTRIRELEASNKRLADQGFERFQLCTRAQNQADLLRRNLQKA